MKLIKNKRGIEITVTFIVTLILAIAILAGSIVLMRQFFAGAEKTKLAIDSQTDSQIKSLLAGGAKVAVPVNKVTAHRGDFVTFGVGILNVLRAGNQPADNFDIVAGQCEGTSLSINAIQPVLQQQSVNRNDQKIFLIGYQIPKDAPRETYICNIEVLISSSGNQYAESVYKAYIVVE